MKKWYLIVRKEKVPSTIEICGTILTDCKYPPEGFAILAYDDKDRAELYAQKSSNNYRVVEVCEVKNDC